MEIRVSSNKLLTDIISLIDIAPTKYKNILFTKTDINTCDIVISNSDIYLDKLIKICQIDKVYCSSDHIEIKQLQEQVINFKGSVLYDIWSKHDIKTEVKSELKVFTDTVSIDSLSYKDIKHVSKDSRIKCIILPKDDSALFDICLIDNINKKAIVCLEYDYTQHMNVIKELFDNNRITHACRKQTKSLISILESIPSHSNLINIINNVFKQPVTANESKSSICKKGKNCIFINCTFAHYKSELKKLVCNTISSNCDCTKYHCDETDREWKARLDLM